MLLITSRSSGRWVIPKGNVPAGMDLHRAAALEAEEEAGVLGVVCPIPLGSYRYRKHRANGASLMADVQVFPMAVNQELPQWKEQAERQRRWCTLADAATMVDEHDLRDLMQSFGASQFRLAARRVSLLEMLAERTRFGNMFAWFQRLLPKTGNFFDLFERHAATIQLGAEALTRLLHDPAHRDDHIREIRERENDADEVTRATLSLVRQSFLTPFDRSAIINLITAMDDAIDEMQGTAGAIDLYDVRDFDQDMRDMAGIIVDCTRLVIEAVPLLRDVARNAGRLNELTERIIRLEGFTDDLHRAALKRLFNSITNGDTRRFIAISETYKHLERVVDAFENVAKGISSIVVDHA